MKIVIVRLSAIGDCCLVFPMVKTILRQIPNAEIDWIIGKAAYSLLKDDNHPRLNYHVIDKPKKIKDYLAIRNKYKNKKVDYLLAMQASTRANLIYPMISAKQKIGFDFKRARELQWLFTNKKIDFKKEHLHDSFCQFAQELGVNTENLDWTISIPTDKRAATLEKYGLNKKYIVLNPAASKLERSWQEQKYAELIDWIKGEYKTDIVLTGSNANFELKLAENIENLTASNIINLVGKTSLQELAIILEQSELLVAPDTGPAHIANAMETAVVGLYAVAPSWLSAPYHSRNIVIDKFSEAVVRITNKNPNELPWRFRVHDRAAMDLISLDDVKAAVKKLLVN